MPTAVFEQLLPGLPRPLRRLVGAIEDRAGLSIDATPHGERMACDFGRRRAVIQVPDGGPPRDSASVYHELLHLKRYFVDGIPKLVYCDDAHEFESDADARLPQLFERLDNQIEHLFIVPHELARYRGARDATGQGGSTPCSGIPGSRMTVSSWCGHSFVGSWETISWLTPHRRVS